MSNYAEYPVNQKVYGKNTQTAATVITQLIEPHPNGLTRISGIRYRNGTAAQILYLMRPFNKVYVTVAGAGGAANAFTVSADPGKYSAGGACATADNLMAANDYIVYQNADGTYTLDTIASVTGLAITPTGNIPTGGLLIGKPVWWFGIQTDTNPNDNQVTPAFNILANTIVNFGLDDNLGTIPDNQFLNLGKGINQPLILLSNNVTNQGFLEETAVQWYRKAAA